MILISHFIQGIMSLHVHSKGFLVPCSSKESQNIPGNHFHPYGRNDQSQTTGVVSFQDPNNSPIGPDVDNNHLLVIVTIVAMQKTLLVMKVNTPGNPPPPMASQSGNFSPYWPWPLITQDPLANIARKSKQICLKVFIQTWNKSP